MRDMRSWSKPGKLTARNTAPRPPPAGNSAGTGQQSSLNNPFGARPAPSVNAPNQPPGPPSVLTQMGGLSVSKPAKPPMKPRSGDEYRAPKPMPDQLSPSDRVNTIAHLAATSAVAASHAAVHSKAVKEEAAKKKPSLARIRHNAAHAAKHDEEVVQHQQKQSDHLKRFPGAESAAEELLQASPSKTAKPPKGAK